jgi:hypothetical protein
VRSEGAAEGREALAAVGVGTGGAGVEHHDGQLVHDDGRAEVGNRDRLATSGRGDAVGEVLDEVADQPEARKRVAER